jgi:hypothetical protein
MKFLGQELSLREATLLSLTLVLVLAAGILWITRSSGASGTSPSEIKEMLQADEERLERSLKEAARRRKELGLGSFTLPDPATDSPKVHLHIEKTARASGLEFSSLSSTAQKKGKGALTIGYRFTATSELKSLVRFIDDIQSGEYLICLENWSMKPTNDPKKVQTEIALRAYFQPPARGSRR